jgi:hypothetical protein
MPNANTNANAYFVLAIFPSAIPVPEYSQDVPRGVMQCAKCFEADPYFLCGANRTLNALSCVLTLYNKSTMTSVSFTASALKFFLTARPSWSLFTLRFDLCRAIVGEYWPMPLPRIM